MEILRLALAGGLLGLDGTSVGQFMISRPLVAGAAAGWLLGDPATGIAVGAILELYLLVSFPTGGAAFPEGATATVVAVGTATAFDVPGALPAGVALGLVWGQVAAVSITWQRRAVTLLVPEPGDPVRPGGLGTTVAAALALDFARGTLVTAAGMLTGLLALGPWVSAWPLDAEASTGLLLVGGAVSAGIMLHDVGGVRGRGVWLAVGTALGAAGALLT